MNCAVELDPSIRADKADDFENGGDGAEQHDDKAKGNDGEVGSGGPGAERCAADDEEKERGLGRRRAGEPDEARGETAAHPQEPEVRPVVRGRVLT